MPFGQSELIPDPVGRFITLFVLAEIKCASWIWDQEFTIDDQLGDHILPLAISLFVSNDLKG